MSRTAPPETTRARGSDPWLWAIVALAALARIPGLATDFWLDEIWTLKMVEQRMDTAFDVFTQIRHSNNHHLNTLYFHALGVQEQWSLYRLPSLFSGIASVWLAHRIAARFGRLEAGLAAWLCASSYLLIHFSSEARGYAPVVFFSLLAVLALQRFRDAPGPASAALFGFAACAGFLSHLMFLHTFVAALAWTLYTELRARTRLPVAARRLAALFGPAGLFILWLYWIDIRATKIGDGPELDASDVLVRALSYAAGGPPRGDIAAVAAFATLAAWLLAVGWWAYQRRDEWVFFATVIFVSPAVSFALLRPELFFVRYFLLGTTFGYIALALPLAAGWRAEGRARSIVAMVLTLSFVGNAVLTARFYRDGRGGYLATMRHIAETTDVAPTVAGDHRFRTGNVIRFYNRYLPPNQQLVFVPQEESPEWMLLHRIGELGRVSPALAGPDGHTYTLEFTAPYSDLSGWHWLAYRRAR